MKKTPWLAGLLNFLIPGVGFLYLTEPFYIVVGIVCLLGVFLKGLGSGIRVLTGACCFTARPGVGPCWPWGFWPALAVILAVLGYVGAKQINLEQREAPPATK